MDLGDQGSHYCILGLEGETLAEGQLRTTQEDFASFFQGLNAALVVVEVGTHSAWVHEVISGCGHEVLVANPRLMDGSKRRKRKNDRIDANKLARLGRVDPESLYPIQHRSREVRQDLVMLRARDAFLLKTRSLNCSTCSLVLGKTGDVDGFIRCTETRQPLLLEEAEKCKVSNRLVVPGLLVACEVTGDKVLPQFLETSAASEKRALRLFFVSSSISGARLLPDEGIK